MELEYWVCFTDQRDPGRVVDPIAEGFISPGVRRVFVGPEAELNAIDLATTLNNWPSCAAWPNVSMPGHIKAHVSAFIGV
jgi:hypothetical protein